MRGKEDREPGARINREAVARLIGQPPLIKVARGILDHETGTADRVYWLPSSSTCKEMHAGQIALAAVLMRRDEAAGHHNKRAVFAMIGIEVL